MVETSQQKKNKAKAVNINGKDYEIKGSHIG